MTKAFYRQAFALAVLASASGCYRATFYRDPAVHKAEAHEQWTNFYIFGLVGSQDFDVHEFCPSGDPAIVMTGGNFATGFVSVITLGVYTPRKVYVTCAANRAGASRTLEIALNRRGEPVFAEATNGGLRSRLLVASSGPNAWQLSERVQ